MFNLTNRFLDFYEKNVKCDFFYERKLENVVVEKATFVAFKIDSRNEFCLYFVMDENVIGHAYFQRIDRNKIKESWKDKTYDSVNHILNHYKLTRLFQQEECFRKLVDDLKRQAVKDGASVSREIEDCGISTETPEGRSSH